MSLAGAFRFATYDTELNLFKVNRDLTETEDRGTYPILVKCQVNKGMFSRTFRFMFILTVWDDNPLLSEPAMTSSWFPPDPIIDNYRKIYYHGERIIKHVSQDVNELARVDRPIPYVHKLRLDGVLIIGWDQ